MKYTDQTAASVRIRPGAKKRILDHLRGQSMSQSDLAAMAGVSAPALSRILSGKSTTRLATAQAIHQHSGINLGFDVLFETATTMPIGGSDTAFSSVPVQRTDGAAPRLPAEALTPQTVGELLQAAALWISPQEAAALMQVSTQQLVNACKRGEAPFQLTKIGRERRIPLPLVLRAAGLTDEAAEKLRQAAQEGAPAA